MSRPQQTITPPVFIARVSLVHLLNLVDYQASGDFDTVGCVEEFALDLEFLSLLKERRLLRSRGPARFR